MLKSRKHVFWEALLVTIGIFLVGLFLGLLIETGSASKINNLYLQSEISLVDGTATSNFIKDSNFSCETLKNSNIEFANRIYEEAKTLEKLEISGMLTQGMKFLHKKYDLLRTLLWMSNQEVLLRCNNYHLIVYLYEYETEENSKKATQNVWSKILLDIKMENEDVVLIPIAADQDLSSLNLLIDKFNITQFPAVVVDNKKVLYNLDNLRDELN